MPRYSKRKRQLKLAAEKARKKKRGLQLEESSTAPKYLKEHLTFNGDLLLTVSMFCQWVNDDLLPNESLEPAFPTRISNETARKWMHELGFGANLGKK